MVLLWLIDCILNLGITWIFVALLCWIQNERQICAEVVFLCWFIEYGSVDSLKQLVFKDCFFKLQLYHN